MQAFHHWPYVSIQIRTNYKIIGCYSVVDAWAMTLEARSVRQRPNVHTESKRSTRPLGMMLDMALPVTAERTMMRSTLTKTSTDWSTWGLASEAKYRKVAHDENTPSPPTY